jgi:Uma2 family endonuclease
MDVSHTRLSNADYISLPDDGKRYELHEGVLIEMPSPSPLHVWVVTLLVRVISNYVIERSLGFVAADNLDYFMGEGVVLKPDVSFAANIFPPFAKRFEFAPDLAVEILSPSNSASEINYKVKSYLQYGSRLVWVIDPDRQLATIYHKQADGQILTTHLTIEGILNGEDVLPDFRLPMKDLFGRGAT